MSGFYIPSYLDYSDGEADFKHLADSFTRRGPIRFKPVSGYYTAVPADTDVVLRCDGTTEITIPADVFGEDNFATGAQVAVLNYSEKRVVIEPAAGVTINGPQRLSVDRWRWGVLVKQNANLWLLSLGNMGGGDAKGVPLPPKITACFGISAGAGIVWDKPVDDGGSPITQYIIEQSTDEKEWEGAGVAKADDNSITVNDLKVGTKYFFRVKAVNANGISDPSNIADATPTQVYNDAEGGTVTTYTKNGRIFRVHTFTRDEPFRVRKAGAPFRVFVQGGGGGGVSNGSYGGGPDGDGGFGKESSFDLKEQSYEVKVGAGCAVNTGNQTGGTSSFADLLSATGGAGGAIGGAGRTQGGNSDISGAQVQYGKGGYKTPSTYDGSGSSQTPPEAGSGSGGSGNGNGAGGGNPGVVIVSYEMAPSNDCEGGTVTYYKSGEQNYKVHTFKTDDTFKVNTFVDPFRVLIVGGGGGSGLGASGAAGAGRGGPGYNFQSSSTILAPGSYAVAVGKGGPRGTGCPTMGGGGGSSSLATVATAKGGSPGGNNGQGCQDNKGCPIEGDGGPSFSSDISGTAVNYCSRGQIGNYPDLPGWGGYGENCGNQAAAGRDGIVIISYPVAQIGESVTQNEGSIQVARVTREGNVVVNVESVTQEFLNENANDVWFYFVTYDDNLKDNQPTGIPTIGLHYDPVTNAFEEAPSPKADGMTGDEIEEAERIVKGTKRASTKRSS